MPRQPVARADAGAARCVPLVAGPAAGSPRAGRCAACAPAVVAIAQSVVVWLLVFPRVTRKTRVQVPAAEFRRVRGAALRPVCEVHASAIARRHLRLSSARFSADTPAISPGTWCSVITPAQRAGGTGFNHQCVHASAHSTCCSCCFSAAFTTDGCARFSRSRPCARDGAAGGAADTYSLRGSNPRPIAHKTIALTTELSEHAVLAMPMPSCGIGASALRSLCCALGATRSLRRQRAPRLLGLVA